jgi:ABC-2 type transport system ATP-binding protein
MTLPVPAVTLAAVAKHFGATQALHALSAGIPPGRLTGLVGPDGAGKTTLMRLIAGLLTPSAGSITVAGLDTVRDSETLADVVGYMPQRFGLYEDLTVHENLRLYAELRALERGGHARVFERLLAFTRLAPFTGRLAGQLSGGMKQKLGLACALMGAPKVLLLDEPGVGVDPLSRQDLWRMVRELTGEGMAVVWATAYLDEAERCDTVLLLNEGQLKFSGPPAALSARLQGRSFKISALNGDGENYSGAFLPSPMCGRGVGGEGEHKRDGLGDHPLPQPLSHTWERGAFHVKPDWRKLLQQALDLPSICDGTIQGSALHVLLREGATPDALQALADGAGARLEPTPPRFEDAFVDLLGGGPNSTSALAARMPAVRLDTEYAIECRRLTRRFGAFTATDDVSFQVGRGEIFGLLGPNGAGKSTTFKMLCGLLKPSAGEARVAGLELRHAGSDAKRKLGYMAQKFSLYGLLSVRQNLEFYAGVYGLDGDLRRRRIAEMVETFQLERFLSGAPEQLPLGYKQRLALACALMHSPPVLFLDEPTSGVDPITRREFWNHINGLAGKGVTVMVTTHFMDEAEYCDRVALMYRARLIALDTPDALKAQASAASMEDAFIRLIERADAAFAAQHEEDIR